MTSLKETIRLRARPLLQGLTPSNPSHMLHCQKADKKSLGILTAVKPVRREQPKKLNKVARRLKHLGRKTLTSSWSLSI